MKTSELIDAALDWAVALCECGDAWRHEEVDPHFYSTDWSQGGPIIERERIDVTWSETQWVAMWWADNSGMAKNSAQSFVHNRQKVGPTPLIAAMRAYVASKMGEEVDVPAELED